MKVGTIGVIGAGTMGTGIVQIAASAGHIVHLFDENARLFEHAVGNIKETFKKLVEKGKMTSAEAGDIIGRIHFAENISEFHDCELVIEAIVEDLEIKQKVFIELESGTGSNTILATNTSSLSVTSIAGACKNPGRVLGLHFFNPAPVMPLVEVIPGFATNHENIKRISDLMRSWKKVPVLAKDTPGFIVNRVARPFYGEALRIYEESCYGLPEGSEGMATIDWAMREFGDFKMGPFELMDLIGNDINYKVTETVWSQFYFDPRYKPALTQKRMVEAGRLGRKSKQGFYSYGEGAVQVEAKKDEELGKKIFHRILAMLINEAVDALCLKIATAKDIDLAMTKGVNYPKGLLKWCDDIGAKKVLQMINDLRSEYEEERYRPSVLLKQISETDSKFFS
jgi:3-hydroxybutyryl-CoA dehydrogenase